MDYDEARALEREMAEECGADDGRDVEPANLCGMCRDGIVSEITWTCSRCGFDHG